MQAQQWTDILKLLSMMVIDSQKTINEERKVFVRASLSLRNALYPSLNLTEEMAGDWIDLHREEIKRSTSHLYFEKSLNTLLSSLRSLPDKKPLILTMIKITMTDGDRSKHENLVIGGMNEVWGNPRAELMTGT